MKLLLLAGAGTSIELGVPGMSGMATEFLSHARQWDVEPNLIQKIMGDILDVEHLIEGLDLICAARPSLEAIGENQCSYNRVDKVRAEVEWFVQHAAERLVARDAQLMWSSVLRASRNHEIMFVTTNYDRAIELAANAEHINLDDGFDIFGQGEISPWIGFTHDAARPQLIKLHGSTDWYALDAGIPTKLRHPMPLFGRSMLRLAGGQELGSALVLPSREKLLTRDPYPRLSQAFLNAADGCDLAVFIGTSLRDHHIRGAATSIAPHQPLFIVNPDGECYGIPHAQTIAQQASVFLVSTLPDALTKADPCAALHRFATVPKQGVIGGVTLLREALDKDMAIDRRCRAIEDLDRNGITLDESFVRELLSDKNPTVARYSLGLVATSVGRDRLIKAAAESPHSVDTAYIEELNLLKVLMEAELLAKDRPSPMGQAGDG